MCAFTLPTWKEVLLSLKVLIRTYLIRFISIQNLIIMHNDQTLPQKGILSNYWCMVCDKKIEDAQLFLVIIY